MVFVVDDIDMVVDVFVVKYVIFELIRVDELIGKWFIFFCDFDGLLFELYEV